jgi:hypothetical protein
MESAVSKSKIDIAREVMNSAQANIQNWVDLCYRFKKWEQEAIILRNPSQEDSAKHKKALATLLKSTRYMLTLACDPESSDSDSYSKLSILQEQFQHSWEMLYKLPSDREAVTKDAMLAEIFRG